MIRFHTPLAAFVVAAVATSAPLGQDEALSFERPADLGLRIATTETHTLTEGRVSLKRGDADEEVLPVRPALATQLTGVVIDENRANGVGLRRAYLEGAGSVQVGAPGELPGQVLGPQVELESRLAGLGVAFIPSKDAPGGYGRHYDTPLESQERILPRLEAPTDWSGLLPPEGSGITGREKDEEWDVDPRALRSVIAPIGFLALEGKGGDDVIPLDPRMRRALRNGVGGNLQVAFEGELTGTVRASVQSIESTLSDGAVSVIRIEFSLEGSSDRTASIAAGHTPAPGEPAADVLSAVHRVSLEGTTTVRWSPQVNRPLSLVTTADETILLAVSMVDGEQQVTVETLEFGGTYTNTTEVGDALIQGSARAR